MVKMTVLKGGRVVAPDGVIRKDIAIADGKLTLSDAAGQGDNVVDVSGKYILPGFVDIHIHGYALFDFTSGLFDPQSRVFDKSPETYTRCIDGLRKQLAAFGVTKFYLTNLNDTLDELRRCYASLADYMGGSADPKIGARLCGGMLEAPFINRNMAGAQSPDLVLEPSIEAFDKIDDHGTIKLANVVPDSGEKSCALTAYLTEKGVVVGAGHTSATCDQVAEAIKAGLKYCIHFTNGPTGSSYKPFDGGGATEAVLKFDELYAEQICDGFHINPAYVRDIVKRKGVDRIVGVTDCMHIAGSSVKEFSMGGVRGAASEDGNYLRVVDKANTLFGSNLTMNRGFANMLSWLTCQMPGIWNRSHPALELDDALAATAQMFATSATELTGLVRQGYGRIVDGAAADLTVVDIIGSAGDYRADVVSTIVDGNVVYSAE